MKQPKTGLDVRHGTGVTVCQFLNHNLKDKCHRTSKTSRKWRMSNVHVYLPVADYAPAIRPVQARRAVPVPTAK